MDNNTNDAQALLDLRKQIFITGYKGGMAHLASCYSSLEMIYTLYLKGILRYDPANPQWEDRDRFILSKGHAGMALYAVMVQAGLLSPEDYNSYLQPGCKIGGEPCMRDCPWVEATTGSLGHGLSMAVGIAMALKMNQSPAKVYVMLGDGECQEGSIWEAAMSASFQRLDNLIAILDCNGIQKMDCVETIAGVPMWQEKWTGFGWQVEEMDGHDPLDIQRVLQKENTVGKPRLVIAHTVKGKGVSIMEGDPNWHFRLPGRRELKVFKAELGIEDWELE